MVLDDTAAGGGGRTAQVQRLFAVKAGRNALLDVARTTYNDNYDDIVSLVQSYRDNFGSKRTCAARALSSHTQNTYNTKT